MDNYPSNSKKATEKVAKPAETEDRKKVEKVITGEAVLKKPSLGKRFMRTFFGGDTRDVRAHIVDDVLVPAIKDTITDMVTQGIERALFGESRSGRSRSRPSGSGGYVQYNRVQQGSRLIPNEPRREISRRARTTHDFAEIVLETRVEAEEVLTGMYDLLSQFNAVSVADLYELAGVSSNFVDRQWGWTNLAGSQVVKIRGGYLVDLTPPEPID